jgi:hypothetical protein
VPPVAPPSAPGPADLPDKPGRPPAFDRDLRRYQWRFRRIPDQIRLGHQDVPNPFRTRALMVVHGIGEQKDTETAVQLRVLMERAVAALQPDLDGSENAWIVPEPYIFEGYWANYEDLEWLDPDDVATLGPREKEFFTLAWRTMATRGFASWRWLAKMGFRLIMRGSWGLKLFYAFLTLFLLLAGLIILISKRFRHFMTGYVNDARAYLEPKGDAPLETVQLIDHRIGEECLRLFGCDWELDDLPRDPRPGEPARNAMLTIGGVPHRFDEVVWVGHSLGSVISYNVIGDIFEKCSQVSEAYWEELDARAAAWKAAGGQGDEPTELEPQHVLTAKKRNAERIFSGLRHFVTLGSPLDKIAFLYSDRDKVKEDDSDDRHVKHNGVLRQWTHLPPPRTVGARKSDGSVGTFEVPFWLNFFYGGDYVSGPINLFGADTATNIHTRGRLRIPGYAHVQYWKDREVGAKILEVAFSGEEGLLAFHRLKAWGPKTFKWLVFKGWVYAIAGFGAILVGLYFAIDRDWLPFRTLWGLVF